MQRAMRETPAAYLNADGTAEHLPVRALSPTPHPELLKMTRIGVIVRPIDHGRFAMSFPSGKKLKAMLAFVGDAFQLSHLS